MQRVSIQHVRVPRRHQSRLTRTTADGSRDGARHGQRAERHTAASAQSQRARQIPTGTAPRRESETLAKYGKMLTQLSIRS